MLSFAEPNSPLREPATWWLLNRHVERLGGLRIRTAAGAEGSRASTIPTPITLKEVVVPPAPADLPKLSIDEIATLNGDAARGKNAATRCLMCHSIGGTGAEFGPALDGWGRGKSADVDRHRHRPARAPRSRTATTASRSRRRTA